MNTPYDNDTSSQTSSVCFYSDCNVVKASDGPISVTLSQSVGGVMAPDGAPPIHFEIQGPWNRLQPSDVVGTYPADGSNTSPEEFIAHIALGRRSLPWERDGIKDESGNTTPWLALLLFKESEIVAVGGAQVRTLNFGQLKSEDPKSYAAAQSVYTDDTSVDVVRIDREVLAGVLPRKSELALLCHMQQLVAASTPAPAGGDDSSSADSDGGDSTDPMWALDPDCYVGIVMGNRLPDAGNATTPAEKHYACLVTIEKRDDLPWPAAQRPVYPPPAPPPHVTPAHGPIEAQATIAREINPALQQVDPNSAQAIAHADFTTLVVLRYWSFTPSQGGDFEQVVRAIRYSPNGGVLRLGYLPRYLSVNNGLDTITTDGGFDLAHRQGGTARYRGPLTPAAPPPRSPGIALEGGSPPPAAPGGEPDETYASAFELGRLLTLANDGLLADLQDVRLQLVLPQVSQVYTMSDVPPALQQQVIAVDPPDWGSLSSFTNSEADPAGVQSILAQAGTIASQIQGGTIVTPVGAVGAQGVVDIDTAVGADLDVQFSQVVAAARS